MPRLRTGSKYCTVGIITDQASIDRYAALLAPGYKKASRKWWPDPQDTNLEFHLSMGTRSVIPSVERISKAITNMTAELDRPSLSLSSSGGIRVHWIFRVGEMVKMLQVDWTIAAHIPVLNNNSGEDA